MIMTSKRIVSYVFRKRLVQYKIQTSFFTYFLNFKATAQNGVLVVY